MAKTIKLGSLTIEIVETPQSVSYTFKGDVDDTFKHGDVPRVKSSKIILDLEGITNFNSCGVREWVFLIKDLGQIAPITFTKCSIPMVDQFNMVPESIGNGTVETFFAPYVCEQHGDVEQLLDVVSDKWNLDAQQPPDRACSTCKNPLIFDAMADSYFLFLAPTKTKLSRAS
jgi:eukaryotic-like serine/threonine-protein kinase